MNNKGKIIAIIGAPASGKSTLVRHWNENYGIKTYLEGEEADIPDYVKENIAQNKNGLQTILFFHNQEKRQYQEALKLKEQGEIVVLDTFWISNIFYIDTMVFCENEKKLLHDMIDFTKNSFTLPDTVVFLDISDQLLAQRMNQRGREFEKSFIENALKVSKSHKEIIEQPDFLNTQIIKVQADDLCPDKLAQDLGLEK